LYQIDRATWIDLARAVRELALARVRLARSSPAELLDLEKGRPRGEPLSGAAANDLVQRVSFAIGCASPRLPWRTTCLVQALAAQHWLAGRGVETHLYIGVHKDAAQAVNAHAWLAHGDTVITGADITGFQSLVTPEVLGARERCHVTRP
jgi:hypothetical protein